ncbi:MAG TPA: hypothetical protein VK930_02720, partial [Verrucomicrobiae bacterium]|nr:hypothetical protein [Verrucomicrobiae bacterium]
RPESYPLEKLWSTPSEFLFPGSRSQDAAEDVASCYDAMVFLPHLNASATSILVIVIILYHFVSLHK